MSHLPASLRPVLQRLSAALRGRGLTPADEVVVAFSGGADSVGLLALLRALPAGVRPRVRAVHVDHGLREGSAAEALRARAIAEGLGVEARILVVQPEGKGGTEARARRARYAALSAEAAGAPVLTAHTADDQAETLLLRLARGAGSAGLRGILPVARLHGALILRPLLGVRRAELREVVRLLALPIVEDPSNRSPLFARNRVRAGLLPALDHAVPGATAVLARTAALLAQDERYLARAATRAATRLSRDGGLEVAGLLRLPAALRGRVLRGLVLAAGGGIPAQVQVDQLLRAARKGGEAHLPGSLLGKVEGGVLTIRSGPTGAKARRGSRGEEAGGGTNRDVEGFEHHRTAAAKGRGRGYTQQ